MAYITGLFDRNKLASIVAEGYEVIIGAQLVRRFFETYPNVDPDEGTAPLVNAVVFVDCDAEDLLQPFGEVRPLPQGKRQAVVVSDASDKDGGGDTLRCAQHGHDIVNHGPCARCEAEKVVFDDPSNNRTPHTYDSDCLACGGNTCELED